MPEAEQQFREIIGYKHLAALALAVERDVTAGRAATSPSTTPRINEENTTEALATLAPVSCSPDRHPRSSTANGTTSPHQIHRSEPVEVVAATAWTTSGSRRGRPSDLAGDRAGVERVVQRHRLGNVMAAAAGRRDGQRDARRVDEAGGVLGRSGAVHRGWPPCGAPNAREHVTRRPRRFATSRPPAHVRTRAHRSRARPKAPVGMAAARGGQGRQPEHRIGARPWRPSRPRLFETCSKGLCHN